MPIQAKGTMIIKRKKTAASRTSSGQQNTIVLDALMTHPKKILDTLEDMQRHGKPLWRDILYVCMGSCKDMSTARRMHSLLMSSSFDSVSVLGDLLVRLFGTCEELFEASLVFCNIDHPSEFSWQSVIWTHHVLGKDYRALELYEKMQQQQDLRPGKHIISTILRSCASIKALRSGMLVHGEAIQADVGSDIVVGSCLIDMYVNSCCLQEARNVFDNLPSRNEIVWNVMIEGYAQHEDAFSALYLFEKMKENGVRPGKVTFLCILKVCQDESIGLQWGRCLHKLILESQLESDIEIRSALVDLYARLGSLDEAHELFVRIPKKNIVEWGAMIAGYAQHGQGNIAVRVFEDMQRAGVAANEVVFSSVLKGTADKRLVDKGMIIHSQIICSGLDIDAVLGSSLVELYVAFGDLNSACRVFTMLPIKNVVTWSVLISGYAVNLDTSSAIQLLVEMQQEGIEPDRVTFAGVLHACSDSLATLAQGRITHSQIIEKGLDSDVTVANSLVRMFAICGSPEDALRVFDGLSLQQAEAWGELISAYVRSGLDRNAMELFERAQNEGIMVGKSVVADILKAYGSVRGLSKGKLIHGQLIDKEYKTDLSLGNALLDMYVSCGAWKEARKVFSEMSMRDLVSWNTMMTGYNQCGDSHQALQLFENMQQNKMEPDIICFSCALKACCNVGSLEQGQVVHDQVLRSGLQFDVIAGNTLVDLYAKCGSLQDARKVFDGLPNRNEVSWNSLIAGYADHGSLSAAEKCFGNMQEDDLKPSALTYSSMFSACSHAGQVKEGQAFFQSMTEDCNVSPTIEHFNCMVDSFARTGLLCEAEQLLHVTPLLPDAPGWTSLLTACKVHNNSAIGQQCHKKLGVLDDSSATGD